jgi:hypothetical protein
MRVCHPRGAEESGLRLSRRFRSVLRSRRGRRGSGRGVAGIASTAAGGGAVGATTARSGTAAVRRSAAAATAAAAARGGAAVATTARSSAAAGAARSGTGASATRSGTGTARSGAVTSAARSGTSARTRSGAGGIRRAAATAATAGFRRISNQRNQSHHHDQSENPSHHCRISCMGKLPGPDLKVFAERVTEPPYNRSDSVTCPVRFHRPRRVPRPA